MNNTRKIALIQFLTYYGILRKQGSINLIYQIFRLEFTCLGLSLGVQISLEYQSYTKNKVIQSIGLGSDLCTDSQNRHTVWEEHPLIKKSFQSILQEITFLSDRREDRSSPFPFCQAYNMLIIKWKQ